MRKPDNKLYTPWGQNLDRNNVLPEYPRPQLVRSSYINLNGEWDYAIYPQSQEFGGYQGKILVPFSPECILSGVEKTVTPKDVLYYRRSFALPEGFNVGRVLLHFGAVDYSCQVQVNGQQVGGHKGGYLPFDLDITDALKEGDNELTLAVTDPSEQGNQARGKQIMGGSGIWYAPISGIWQTVWLESVPKTYIRSIRLTPDIDDNCVSLRADVVGEDLEVTWKIMDGDKVLAKGAGKGEICLKLINYEYWSPENPKLYDVVAECGEDRIQSYLGMRKFGLIKDEKGLTRLALNNKPYFQNGLLDQGYWSDGMYTAPTDEAMIYDIQTMKDMGFNMLRKHIKVEPLRWYYHCDRLGMLVWQDMVSGGAGVYNGWAIGLSAFLCMVLDPKYKRYFRLSDGKKNYKLFHRADAEGRAEYYRDMYGTMDNLINVTSLCLWVPFNEGWGQFDAIKAAQMIREYDPTRLIDHASGWQDQGGGDINSFHIYFSPLRFTKIDKHDDRATCLTEFGGLIYMEPGHMHNETTVFGVNMPGYKSYRTKEGLLNGIRKLYLDKLLPKVQEGLSALVYTQVSDVQDEVNGMLTYDRQVVKIPVEFFAEINKQFKL
ncbi:MAG: glycoside hydrolase family 2 [Clostridia bacterium]|nr:glycoside hydrolase family 2 [Clostridia bacterium]